MWHVDCAAGVTAFKIDVVSHAYFLSVCHYRGESADEDQSLLVAMVGADMIVGC